MSSGIGIAITVVFGLGWLIVAINVLVPATAWFRRRLGEEECLPQRDSLFWFLLAWVFTLYAFFMLHTRSGAGGSFSFSAVLAFASPLPVAFLWALRLRLGARAVRTKTFGWQGETLVRTADGNLLAPTSAITQAIPRLSGLTPYTLYRLELFDDRGPIASNHYVHENAVIRDENRLVRSGCKLLDAEVVWQASPTELYTVALHPWQTLLLHDAGQAMPEDAARFWQQWVHPRFPIDGSAEVATDEILRHLAPLRAAMPMESLQLHHLLDVAGPTVLILSGQARRALEARIQGRKGRKVQAFENGLTKVTLLPKG